MPKSLRAVLSGAARLSLFVLCGSWFTSVARAVVVRGTVTNALGAPVAGARVQLVQKREAIAFAMTRPDGSFEIRSTQSGRFVLFTSGGSSRLAIEPNVSRDFYGGVTDLLVRNVTLETTTLSEVVTVTATGIPTPIEQLTAPVALVMRDDLTTRTGIIDELRQSPGVSVVQSGQYGGVASLFVRGGNSDSNKILIDGIPAEDVGGGFDVTSVSSTGLAFEGNNGPAAELFRGPNSALFGSDALASVLHLTTPRGSTTKPLFTYSGDAGNFRTVRNELTAGGARRKLDYFGAVSRLNSSNSQPNDEFHAVTAAANLGYVLAADTTARFTLRNTDAAQGVPGPREFFGIATNQKQSDQDLYSGLTLENRLYSNWHNLVRYGIARKRQQFITFAPVGTYVPAAFAYYGLNQTITGANGFSVTGRSVTNYAGTFPARYDQVSNRDELYYQSDYTFNRHLTGLFGFRYENERGAFVYPLYATNQGLQRTNFQYTLQVQGDVLNRVFFSLGGALEKNHLYGVRGTPRIGLAYVPVRPGSKLFHGTRLRANFSRGVQEPSLSVQFSSLYGTLLGAGDTADIARYHVTPPNAAESRTYDVGVDQNILNRLVVKAGYFHNEFDHQYEYVSSNALQQYFGIGNATTNPDLFGAYTNSLTFRAQGFEGELQYQPLQRLFVHAGYTYLAPLVQRSFSNDALQVAGATTNPLFPGVTIGASSPLVGQRPFRRAPNTGFFAVQYTGNKFTAALKGAMSGKSDDSTFLAANLLLPNRNLDHGFTKLDASLTYMATSHVTAFTQLDNLFSQQHIGPIGYPSLPFTVRAGLKIRFGGE